MRVADLLPARLQNLLNAGERDILLGHHHEQVVDEVADLLLGLLVFAVFGGNDDLAALLAAFFENLIEALFKQVAGVGALLRMVAPVEHHLV